MWSHFWRRLNILLIGYQSDRRGSAWVGMTFCRKARLATAMAATSGALSPRRIARSKGIARAHKPSACASDGAPAATQEEFADVAATVEGLDSAMLAGLVPCCRDNL